MAATSAALLLAAAGAGALGAIGQGKSAKAEADFAARVNEQQAAREREVAAGEERDFRRVQSANLAERRAALGASGVELDSGTPLVAVSDFAREAELQAQRIRRGGETKATRLEQQADLTRRAGKAAQKQSYFRAGSSLLQGFSNFK